MTDVSSLLERQPDRKEVCELHGEYISQNFIGSIWTKCPVCEQIKIEAREAEREKELAIQRKALWESTMHQAAIPERFKQRTLRNYVADTEGQKNALAFAVSLAAAFETDSKGKSAIFSGERGTGKTHLAVGIALRIMGKYGRTAIFSTVQRYIRAVRDTWSRNSDMSESEVVRMYANPDLLILDEVGVQAGSENEKLLLFDLLNERYENRKSTLLLTNLTVEECRQFLGERVFDRLREDGGEFVVFDWESYRGKQ